MANIEFNLDRVAKLAMLELTDQERAKFQEQLPSIVAYISKLQEVDTSNTDAKTYLSDRVNVFRADEVCDSDEDTHSRLIAAFPNSKGDALEVPGIFE
ncbi:Asp-tRNA(Asn)/Glu-tRNA(Gln) amidotransferase GatCAB subunit C [Candidatus Uhrbacteria bacterium CG_4_9_14_0_2_um_filter_41_50]|uniref:Aspartyl/glutamyl-tRNA(Asn/Gln) amidotransferase subunit C n=1 Tax=Candidatus Uhrbacteria bacterium CG_4_9_14_0_2_um_filter_41_50 TaxID=1975031 RepID=A0A2M8EN84_9BACT|nr:MAG: Asp-tRNA(Asn)/Glu-tRNA(Gln) amidotransferase GatCAB subunit C [Candidatus Uhrbacteria bacterium CG_4_10_14_3_um_filter_41_21]PIZ54209.1 MAG: Asp-tRNA(Asn)/Glu-tRNA(Gln) amidotransferase GatCAB subunit C [Candidatus Uhrbacteria bacterium CG_4_10_14_0_2_um_filter_41_21]PJB84923.1 MAG: Asp-tRNA(Asn)/Glu-tRNA(Gln) amidotransferase GatCAB subunit C [Candidatus Uhrbacteria bacterium CG_4_9_14_0_8_um_filter_41_16]PJC24189.1 MAG: Asp-tRNA(Asn)/Glu-tRNA(Gln) amidotransferase GatCAB subunit C [Can